MPAGVQCGFASTNTNSEQYKTAITGLREGPQGGVHQAARRKPLPPIRPCGLLSSQSHGTMEYPQMHKKWRNDHRPSNRLIWTVKNSDRDVRPHQQFSICRYK